MKESQALKLVRERISELTAKIIPGTVCTEDNCSGGCLTPAEQAELDQLVQDELDIINYSEDQDDIYSNHHPKSDAVCQHCLEYMPLCRCPLNKETK